MNEPRPQLEIRRAACSAAQAARALECNQPLTWLDAELLAMLRGSAVSMGWSIGLDNARTAAFDAFLDTVAGARRELAAQN